MITWDVIFTGLIVGVIAGIGQAIGSWLTVRHLLRKLDSQAKAVVDEAALSDEQKSKILTDLTKVSVGYTKEYFTMLKDAALWRWKKK